MRPAAATTTSALSPESAPATESAPTPAFGFGPGFINGERTSAKFLAIELSYSFCGCIVISYFHKRKAARLARVTVSHDPDLLNFPERTEHIPEFIFGCSKGKVAHK